MSNFMIPNQARNLSNLTSKKKADSTATTKQILTAICRLGDMGPPNDISNITNAQITALHSAINECAHDTSYHISSRCYGSELIGDFGCT